MAHMEHEPVNLVDSMGYPRSMLGFFDGTIWHHMAHPCQYQEGKPLLGTDMERLKCFICNAGSMCSICAIKKPFQSML